VTSHLLYQRITFWMYRAAVERVIGVAYPQETGSLLIGLIAQAGNFLQLSPGTEGTVLVPIINDILSQHRSEPRYIRKNLPRSRIQRYAYRVHAAGHRLIKRGLQLGLVDIVLVLPYADRFRIYLDQFSQRIHQSPTDRNGPANGNIVVRKFLPCNGRCRINRRPAFVHHHHQYRRRNEALDKGFGFAAGRSIPDGDGLNFILLYQVLNDPFRFLTFTFTSMRIYRIVYK